MRTNSLLTYLLYVLLAGLILLAGNKACEMQKEKADKARFEADVQQSLHDLGYKSDSLAAGGSSYDTTRTTASTTTTKDGIEVENTPNRPAANTKVVASPPATTKAATTKVATAPVQSTTTTKNVTTTTPTAVKPVVLPTAGKGKYAVVVGTFSKMEGARTRLEEIIKMGYTNAEIGKIQDGRYAVVVVKRTNNKTEAQQLSDKLKNNGVEARVLSN